MTDTYTKAVLTLIAVLLLAQTLHGYGVLRAHGTQGVSRVILCDSDYDPGDKNGESECATIENGNLHVGH